MIFICGKIRVLQHQHSDICFTTEEVSADTETLTCTIPQGEGAHFHCGDCYDESGSLICALEETSGHHHGQRQSDDLLHDRILLVRLTAFLAAFG